VAEGLLQVVPQQREPYPQSDPSLFSSRREGKENMYQEKDFLNFSKVFLRICMCLNRMRKVKIAE
jgi:hypothetical protein